MRIVYASDYLALRANSFNSMFLCLRPAGGRQKWVPLSLDGTDHGGEGNAVIPTEKVSPDGGTASHRGARSPGNKFGSSMSSGVGRSERGIRGGRGGGRGGRGGRGRRSPRGRAILFFC